ncbi:MAG: GH116 family glycosyl hydrolase [Planctomycetia bacterium]|nr:GH116 family glycosyl hydrolase [Planctomycetia bacterium]
MRTTRNRPVLTLAALVATLAACGTAAIRLAAAQAEEPPIVLTGRVLDVVEILPDGAARFHILPESAQPAAAKLEEAAAILFEDSFDASRKPQWHDAAGTTKAESGKLSAGDDRNLVVVEGIKQADVRVSVTADATAQMGILLRYQDPKNFILAFYTPGAKILGFHEMLGGNLGPWIQPVSTAHLAGKTIRITAEAQGNRVAVTSTDEQGHIACSRARIANLVGAGSVGLYHDASVPAGQRFDNFRAVRIGPRIPPDAVEVVIAQPAGDENAVWAIGRQVRISGRQTERQTVQGVRRVVHVGSLAEVVPVVSHPADRTLFPSHLPGRQWICFQADGFQSQPACGVIYRTADTVTNGMPLGGVDTGCVDLETSGMLGYATIYNTHVPRRGPMNVPILGLSVGGQTWVLCDPQPKDGWGGYQPSVAGRPYSLWRDNKYQSTTDLLTPVPMQSDLAGVRTAQEIHYWGHYPVADLEFETDAPVNVGLRAWAPFFPGDVVGSMLPGAVFEVHLRNTSAAGQSGTIVFSFPGPLEKEGGAKQFSRQPVIGAVQGIEVMAPLASYVLGVIGPQTARLGGELGIDGAAWAKIAQQLPQPQPADSGTSAAVDFSLAPGESRVVRFLVAWHAPDWNVGGGCPQIECIPCSFYGNQPVVYFFPPLALSTLRGYKGYQYPDGAAVWVFGGCTGGTPPIDFASPTKGYQFATNGISLAAMVDRYLLCYGDKQPDFVKEFFPMVKQNMIYTVNLRPAYPLGDRIIAMPAGNVGTEWFEAPEPGWRGMTAHVGGLHLAQLRIAERMARLAGDAPFATQCGEWIAAGATSMNQKLWTGSYYLNYLEPETNSRSDLIFGYQLDGEWITDHHGLPSALPVENVRKTLATIKGGNVAATKYGAANYVTPDGKPTKVGGYGTYSYFPPEALMLAMNYMYEGEKEFGLELARKVWHNIVCTQGYTWDMPNIMRGDVDTGERTYGNDYYQDMMLWSLPAAVEGKDFGAPAKPGGLVDRIIQAARNGKP